MWAAYHRLKGRVPGNRELSLRTQLEIYNSLVLSIGTYHGCAFWNLTAKESDQLEAVIPKILRRIRGGQRLPPRRPHHACCS
jgi:hypothetical protein